MPPNRSRYSLLFISLTYVISFLFYQQYKSHPLGSGDQWGYYVYLPATFIHGDLANLEHSAKFGKHVALQIDAANYQQHIDETQLAENGNSVIKYTLGVAILQAPFFVLAHITSGLLGYAQSGFSLPYRFLALFSGCLYSLFGLWILRLTLKEEEVEDHLIAICLLLTALGTNLYFFSVFRSGMSHAYLFSLYSVLLYATIRFYKKPSATAAILIGISSGMITLIRPVELFCIIIPLSFLLSDFSSIKDRFKFAWQNAKFYLLSIFVFILCGLPQLIYWKYVSGNWLFYSYGDEGFNFYSPHLWKGLTSFSNGWLSYTPIMIFALLGIFLAYRKRRWFWPIVLFLLPHIYITYSWWCWNYINGFGSRPMVQTYALLSIPLLYMLSYTWKRKYFFHAFLLLSGLLLLQNQMNTYQFSKGILWSEEANWNYYKSIIGKTEISRAQFVTYDIGEIQPDQQSMQLAETLHKEEFSDQPNGIYVMKTDQKYCCTWAQSLQSLGLSPGDWIRISTVARSQSEQRGVYQQTLLVSEYDRKSTKGLDPNWVALRVQNKCGNVDNTIWGGQANVWEEVAMFRQLPASLGPNDELKIYFYNPKQLQLEIAELRVEKWIFNN